MLRNNRTLLSGLFFTVTLLCVLFYALAVNAQTAPRRGTVAYYTHYNVTLNSVEGEINSAVSVLGDLTGVRSSIQSQLEDNAEDLRDGLRTTFASAIAGDLGAAVSAVVNGMADVEDGAALLSRFSSANSAVSSQLGVISGIYTRSNNGYDTVYAAYLDAYNALSAEDKAWVDRHGGLRPKKGSPSAETYSLSRCARPSSLSPSCWGHYTDANYHKRTCPEKHGEALTTNVEWWSCFDSQCTRYTEHLVPCIQLQREIPTPDCPRLPSRAPRGQSYPSYDVSRS